MKLLKKVSSYFILFSVLIFVLSSAATYFVLRYLVSEEVDETLASEKAKIVKELKKLSSPAAVRTFRNLEIIPLDLSINVPEMFGDTLIYVPEEQEEILFRQVVFSAQISGKNYRISLRRSLIEKEDLVIGITVMMMVIFVTMILLLNAINYWSERRLWQPFHQTLNALAKFRIDRQRPLNLPAEDITEFNQLNLALNSMAEKLNRDYRNLKEFSENAAHEMQTPLSIMRSKLDVMIQDPALSEKQLEMINSLYRAVHRMARLNRSLNLLTKIENNEFHQKEAVNFSELVEQQLDHLGELMDQKNLKLEKEFDGSLVREFNPLMAETLVSNILVNAVKYNLENGRICIQGTENSLEVSNSGQAPPVDVKQLFERFKKGNPSSDSPGLGLAIVKQICRQNQVDVMYTYEAGFHTIRIRF